jgi:hypothetical protein
VSIGSSSASSSINCKKVGIFESSLFRGAEDGEVVNHSWQVQDILTGLAHSLSLCVYPHIHCRSIWIFRCCLQGCLRMLHCWIHLQTHCLHPHEIITSKGARKDSVTPIVRIIPSRVVASLRDHLRLNWAICQKHQTSQPIQWKNLSNPVLKQVWQNKACITQLDVV